MFCRDVSCRFGSCRVMLFRFGSVRFDSVRFGSVRFGSGAEYKRGSIIVAVGGTIGLACKIKKRGGIDVAGSTIGLRSVHGRQSKVLRAGSIT